MPAMRESRDVVIVGAGAAGLMAGIQAGRAGLHGRVLILDGARSLGAKILISGGGRCNVTHDHVDEKAFAGSTPPAIRNVLKRFDVGPSVEFFRELGVELKREETGKLFPVTDSARTVLNALLGAARDAGVQIAFPRRIERIDRDAEGAAGGFIVGGPWGDIAARRVILATGGRSLPKSGSDGGGYELARRLGHTITPRVLPGLVPLVLPEGHFLRALSGLSVEVEIDVRARTGKRLHRLRGSLLCTHFGLSGPAVMDISRHLLDARMDDPGAAMVINWRPDLTADGLDQCLREAGRFSPGRVLGESLPERLTNALCAAAGVDAATPAHAMKREQRRSLVEAATAMRIPVTGERGWNYAEVTAGGIPLREAHLKTLESRCCPGLHLCGEICDVDGCIGGYNFQWAWASGYVAGTGAARALRARSASDGAVGQSDF